MIHLRQVWQTGLASAATTEPPVYAVCARPPFHAHSPLTIVKGFPAIPALCWPVAGGKTILNHSGREFVPRDFDHLHCRCELASAFIVPISATVSARVLLAGPPACPCHTGAETDSVPSGWMCIISQE